MPEVTLYNKPECPFCWKVRLALHACEVDVRVLDWQAPEHRAQWQALTPGRTVPVMVSGAHVIHESNVILEYLADVSGRLLPASVEGRIRARQLNAYSDGVVGAALREVIFEKRGKPQAEWDLERIRAGVEGFEQALVHLDAQLGESPFFAEGYSFPECALTARFGLAEAYGVFIPDRFPRLQQWFLRMKALPGYRATAPARCLALDDRERRV